MSDLGYTILAIAIILALLAIFFVTYVWNKKTPIPKECQELINKEHCSNCQNITCAYHQKEEE